MSKKLCGSDVSHEGVVAHQRLHSKSKCSKAQIVHVDKLNPCRGITSSFWLDKDESFNEEQVDGSGLSARQEEIQQRTTIYQISLLCSLVGMERSTVRK